MKAVVAAFNQEKALVGAFSVITNLRMELFQALVSTGQYSGCSAEKELQLLDGNPRKLPDEQRAWRGVMVIVGRSHFAVKYRRSI